ncbi:MAG: hypothetical protein IPM54_27485 [Polyangiaceae bacterium]|nr:hypothetical protein [Polyangiaceae bacterium]
MRRTLVIASIGAVLALIPALVLFDFTVDDALIIARYATHIARGAGYRWNVDGPITDTITPLGFPYVLAPFAHDGPLSALAASKLLGLVAWLIGAAFLAVAVDRSSNDSKRFTALLLVPASAPLAAWSVAGLETGIATSLASIAVSLIALGVPRVGTSFIGIAAALRPELTPFAFVVALVPSPGKRAAEWKHLVTRVALAGFPFALVAIVRVALFGRPTPLAVLAKPSDPALGLKYAIACFLLAGPIAIVAPIAVRRAERFAFVLSIAIAFHFGAVAVAGGDWMPLSRLVVPVLPACVLVAAHLASVADARVTALRLLLALAGEIFVMMKIGPSAARVGPDRLELVRQLEPVLRDARVIGALDVGWIGASTEASVVDFAGLTDPAIAALPGGHTTKRIGPSIIDKHGIDTLVLLRARGAPTETPWTNTLFDRGVEQRVARFPDIGDEFVVVAESSMPGLPYIVLRRRDDRANGALIEGP